MRCRRHVHQGAQVETLATLVMQRAIVAGCALVSCGVGAAVAYPSAAAMLLFGGLSTAVLYLLDPGAKKVVEPQPEFCRADTVAILKAQLNPGDVMFSTQPLGPLDIEAWRGLEELWAPLPPQVVAWIRRRLDGPRPLLPT